MTRDPELKRLAGALDAAEDALYEADNDDGCSAEDFERANTAANDAYNAYIDYRAKESLK
jgi:hypothetical protein